MKFIKENIHDIVRLMLNQLALAVFGIVLVSAARMANGVAGVLSLLASIVSILFYLYILYATLQETGSKHRIKVDGNRMKRDNLWGLKVMALSLTPTFATLLLMFIGYILMVPCGSNHICSVAGTNLFAIAYYIVRFILSMYEGAIGYVLSAAGVFDTTGAFVHMTTGPLVYIISFLLMVIPGLLVCWGSYVMGLHDKKLLSFLNNKAPNDSDKNHKV